VRVGGGQKEVETVVDNNIQQGVFKQNSTIIDKTIININSLNSKKATTEKYYPQILTKRLHNEIEDYVKLLQSVVQSQKGKIYGMIEHVKKVVSSLWPESRVEMYGSHATSLCIPSSDLDLVVIGANQSEGDQHPISVLSRALQKERWIRTLQSIETARVPVIKLVGKEERIPTDITFELKNAPAFCTSEGLLAHHEGLASCELVNNFKQKFPQITPLALVLKQLLCERNLNNVYTGGLSSYCLVMMIISFLQQEDDLSKKNLGILLLDFLELYGKNFDYSKQGISISRGNFFDLNEQKFPPAALVIVDPFNPTNNIAQQVIGIARIKIIMEDVHKVLISPFYGGFTPGSPILHRVLKPEFIQKKNGNT